MYLCICFLYIHAYIHAYIYIDIYILKQNAINENTMLSIFSFFFSYLYLKIIVGGALKDHIIRLHYKITL